MVAYNAPDNGEAVEAAFHSLGEAQAYADEYGGSITGKGVVFVVGSGADHDRAKADQKALAESQGNVAPAAAPGLSQADVDAAVARALASERAAAATASGGDSDSQ